MGIRGLVMTLRTLKLADFGLSVEIHPGEKLEAARDPRDPCGALESARNFALNHDHIASE